MKYFTKQWFLDLAGNTGDLSTIDEKVTSYQKYRRSIEDSIPDSFEYAKENMHDCTITSAYQQGSDFVLEINPIGGFSSVDRLIFVNARMLHADEDFGDGSSWEYDELYIDGGKYEVHILATRLNRIVELIIGADNVIVVIGKRNTLEERIRRAAEVRDMVCKTMELFNHDE